MNAKFNPMIIAFAIPAAAVAMALGFIFLKKTGITADEFPAGAYLSNPQSLSGNKYSLKAQIVSRLVHRDGVGSIMEVRTPGGEKLALFVPESLPSNPQTGQRYNFNIAVTSSGQIAASGMEKY